MENDFKLHEPQTIEELQSLVREASAITLNGREGSPSPPNTTHISLSGFQNIVEYQPEEYTITVEAGAKVSDVISALAEQRQYLPFDPPFIDKDSTIGGMIANGYSGPGGYRYGILRDFILGLTFIDGLGNRIKTGGKVVKNAAGFDVPKLMVGSQASLGIITEATFKVFPLPETYRTLLFRFDTFESGHSALLALGRSQFTLDALDLDSQGTLVVRLSGQSDSMDVRIQALETLLGRSHESTSEDKPIWPIPLNLEALSLSGLLLKIPSSPTSIADIEKNLAAHSTQRRYSIGGFVSWIHSDNSVDELSELLRTLDLTAQIVSGDTLEHLIGTDHPKAFYERIKQALDPQRKFADIYKR